MPKATQIARRRSRRRREEKKGGQTAVSILFFILLAIFVGGGLLLMGVLGGSTWAYALATDGLPPFFEIIATTTDTAPAPARFYAQDGTLIHQIEAPTSAWLRWNELPPTAVQSTIAAIAPEYWESDDNTIMNRFLDEQIGVEEPYLRPLIRHRAGKLYSKEQILEWYLNNAYYGWLAYGWEAAAAVYFDKPAADLTLGEAALLASIPTDPHRNPIDAYEAAKTAQETVLERLHQSEQITLDELMAARFLPPQIVPPFNGRFDIIAPDFALYAQQEAEQLYGASALLHDGLEIQTSLNLAWQQQAECVAQAHVNRLSGMIGSGLPADQRDACPALEFLPPLNAMGVDYHADDAAVVMLDPKTGAIQAMVGANGGGDIRAPFTYLTALAQGYTAAVMLADIEQFSENETGIYRGGVRLRQALGSGYASPLAQVTGWVGETAVDQTIKNLNADDGRLLSLTHAFATISNSGKMAGRAEDGRIVPTAIVQETAVTREILTPALAYLMNDMLADRRARCDGYGCPNVMELPHNRPTAVALGGGQSATGYTPDLVTGVWVNGEGMAAVDGAAPIWHALMSWALQDAPTTIWAQPDGLVELSICDPSGQLATAHCPSLSELFIKGTEPTSYDRMYQEVGVNRENGRLATLYTPPELIERRIYQQFPDPLQEWAAESGIPQPPTEYDTLRPMRDVADTAVILNPQPLTIISSTIPISGTAQMEGFSSYRLTYFKGLLPDNLQTIIISTEPVAQSRLGDWDTTGLDGLYTLLLTVMGEDGRFAETSIQVTVDN